METPKDYEHLPNQPTDFSPPIVESRLINKGMVLSFVFDGEMSSVTYETRNDELKVLEFELSEAKKVEFTGTMLYLHVDDETNELLVLSSYPFPY